MSILGGGTQTKPTPPSATLRVQTSVAGKAIPIVYGQTRVPGNLIWYGNFSSRPASGGGKSGGKGGGGGGKGGKGATGSYDYSAFVMVGLAQGAASVLQAWNGSTPQSLASLNFSVFSGSYSQTPWSWLVSNHPDQALAYRGLCYLAAGPFQLGGSPALPNLNYEIVGAIHGTSLGTNDSDPSAVVADLLTNANYGVGFPPERLGNLGLYQSMCIASGLVVSDAIVDQTALNTYLGDLLTATDSEFVWSGGLLTIVPYGNVGSITGNGYTYSAPSVPLFSLTDDDFMANQSGAMVGTSSYSGNDPVTVARKRQADQLNDIKVEYLDRSNSYNPTIAEAMDDAAIIDYGLRTSSTRSMHFFALADAANRAASLELRRQGVLRTFGFTLDQRYIVLDPMDLIEISDEACGLVNQPVLVKEITENADGSLSFVAEEYLGSATAVPLYGTQAPNGYAHDYNAAPPTTNPPVIFAAPPQIANNQGLEIWMVASGPEGWGGCDVWISGDGDTYLNVGRIMAPGRQGVTTAPVAIGSDPDTVNTISIDLSESEAQLLSGTTSDADRANTLCYLDGELIAYSDAVLTSQYNYALDTYIRRGLYGTSISAHPSGSKFARLDAEVFHYPYSVDQIGTTLYVKLTAFNIYGGGEEALSDVSPTSITIPAPPAPPQVQNFSVSERNNVVSFSWGAVQDFALAGYYVGYAPEGTTDRASFLMLTEAGAGTEMTNAEVPAGSWTFGIWATDIAGQFGPGAYANLLVVSQADIIADPEQAPQWLGAMSGFGLHYTGVLVPLGTYAASHYTGWEVFDDFVPDPVSSAYYTAPTIDVGYDDLLRVHATSAATLGPSETGSTPTLDLSIDTWLTGGSDPNTFTAWTIGVVDLRYLRARITYSGITGGNVAYVTEFAPIIDTASPPITITQSATIAPGGSTVTFDAAFHLAPTVLPIPISASPLYATPSMITKTDCVINVWNTAGVSVGGDVNIKIEGQ